MIILVELKHSKTMNIKSCIMKIKKRLRTPPQREIGNKRFNYHSPQWKVIRERVLIRDKYTCVKCGHMANTVDHIIPVKQRPMLALDMDNLQSMCESCHNSKSASERG
jgi:5-methylcytosine-specific restriction endonuclease McrA